MALLASEQVAKNLVVRIGRDRASRLLKAITRRIQRRITAANSGCVTMIFDNTNIRRQPWEVNLIFNLKMGLSLTDYENTPEKARARNLARHQARKTQRKSNLPA